MKRNGKNTLKQNYLYQMLYQIVTLITPLITTPYISRILGSSNIGQYTYAYSIATYFGMFVLLGLSNYGNREIAKVRDDKVKLSKTFIEIYCMQFAMGIFVLCIYIIYCKAIANDNRMALVMIFYIVANIFSITWFYNGLELFKLVVTRNVLIKVLSTILIFCFVKTQNDIYIYAIIMTGDMLLSSLSLWFFVPNYICWERINISEIIRHIRPNCVLFISVLFVSFYTVMDKIMLGILSNMEEVGFYESAYKIISIPTMAIASLGTIMLPRISHMIANNQKEQVKRYNEQSLIVSCFLSIPVSFGILAIAKEFVPFFLGEGFQKCSELLAIMIFSSVFISLGNVVQTQCFIPNGLDRAYVFATIIGASVNMVFNVLLIPVFYSVGAAIGTLLAEISTLLYQFWIASAYINIRKMVFLSFPFVIFGTIMFLGIYPIHLDNTVASIIIKIFIGVAIYLFFSCIYYHKILKMKI